MFVRKAAFARTLAVGDIHGCLTSLKVLARVANFQPDDLIVTLGDYVNRGPDSRGVLNWLIDYSERGSLAPLTGNHDLMMIRARKGGPALDAWLKAGGRATLNSYGPDATLDDVPPSHWKFLTRSLRPWLETKTHLFVHASPIGSLPISKQTEEALCWRRLSDAPEPHISGKPVICGHTAQISGMPLDFGCTVCIDTACSLGGWLTGLDVATGQCWMANERGETQMAWIRSIVDGQSPSSGKKTPRSPTAPAL